MPTQATVFIKSTIAAGLLTLAVGLAGWQSSGLLRYLSCLSVALFCSTLKVGLPGLTGTVSLSFSFVLIGVADFSFGEALVMACSTALVQCLWHLKRRPVVLQVEFGLAMMVVCAAVAWSIPRLLLYLAHFDSTIVILVLGAALYFLMNSILVATAVGLAEEKPIRNLWKQTSARSYAWFLIQTPIAGILVAFTRSHGWLFTLYGALFAIALYLGFEPLSRLVFAQQPLGRKTKRYDVTGSTFEVTWRDRHSKSRVITAAVVNVSEWGASVECAEPISVTRVHIVATASGYKGFAEVCYCQFKNGRYNIGVEFHRGLTRNELKSFLWASTDRWPGTMANQIDTV